LCDERRPQHIIDTDKDWRWNKKMMKTDHQPTTMTEEREEKNEGELSSFEHILFKNLSEAISEYQEEPSEQRRSKSRHDGALEMASQLTNRKWPIREEEPILPNKRPRYKRRNSFVIRQDNNNHDRFPPRSLLEGYDNDEDNPHLSSQHVQTQTT
jgi:hypothetical protein